MYRLLDHQGFALVHGFHQHQLAQPLVCHFHSGQCPGNDTYDLASVSQCGVGQRAHQTCLRAAVHQAQPGLSQLGAQAHSFGAVLWPYPSTRSTKDANPASDFP